METYSKVITELGLPAGLLLLLLLAVAYALYQGARWFGGRVDRVGAFIGPLLVRLVESTEANSRTSEATLQMMNTLNQTIAWNHDRTMELCGELRCGVEKLAEGQNRLGERVGELERRFDHDTDDAA